MSAAHGVEEEEDHFEAAAEQLTVTIATGTRLPDASLLELYALYKQGSEGPCSRPKPSFLDPKGRTKWKAWHDLGAMPREEARDKYVVAVRRLLGGAPEGQPQPAAYGSAGPAVSTPARALGEEAEKGADEAGPLHTALADGDAARFAAALAEATTNQAERRDADGCTPLHIVADAGNVEAIGLLKAKGVDLDLKDQDGMTALHYAALASQREAYEALLEAGADSSVRDAEGQSAADLAPPDWNRA
ncbi:hypothetical protein QBZ16_003088 [Prototheca wickerhamii]|uniref:ACB domain-containing protein n=1 Tax=Prototheca wickerhamii TaxID=3111 RepID=A0AAD9MJ61_PROWI|nr:hypothetical protein QBZ16_003088 [Prototheca wickerhamii]